MSGFDTVIIGSGFGGAVMACRLAEKGARVLVLERGRRWSPSTYPSVTMKDWLWDEDEPEHQNGWLDFRYFGDMSVAMGAAVGGGSHIYANVSIEAPEERFRQGWPAAITHAGLQPHYARVGDMLDVLRTYDLLPALFFLKSRADCGNALKRCMRNRIADDGRRDALARRTDELLTASPHLQHHKQLWHLQNLGLGAHHSGQLPAWKLLLETLMSEGLLDAVFATSTVAAGVNFPARTILFLNSDRFNGQAFAPLTPTEFHQMTGRAGRRGMDKIGFAIAVPSRFMDARLAARLVSAPPSDVASQIRINFSMVLNLLLSHSPEQIEALLKRSFATFQLLRSFGPKTPQRTLEQSYRHLWDDFRRHLEFLQEHGYVDPDGRLTGDGSWASQLRVDQPLLIGEGFRRNALPEKNPAIMAGIIAAFVNERECDDQIDKKYRPRPLTSAFQQVRKSLAPFARQMHAARFPLRPLYLRPAAVLYHWARGMDWEEVVALSELEEGNLAMLILRTADNLRHIRSLAHVFPEAAECAATAVEAILRDPVITDL